MTDKDFYDRIDKARSLFTSREAVTRYCHDIRMLEDKCEFSVYTVKIFMKYTHVCAARANY